MDAWPHRCQDAPREVEVDYPLKKKTPDADELTRSDEKVCFVVRLLALSRDLVDRNPLNSPDRFVVPLHAAFLVKLIGILSTDDNLLQRHKR